MKKLAWIIAFLLVAGGALMIWDVLYGNAANSKVPFQIGGIDCGQYKTKDDGTVQIVDCPPLYDLALAWKNGTPTPTPEPTPGETPDVLPTIVSCPHPVIPAAPGYFAYRQAPSKAGTTEHWCVSVPSGQEQRITFKYISYGVDNQCAWWAMTVTSPAGETQAGPGANNNGIAFQKKPLASGLYTVVLDNQSGPTCGNPPGNPTYRFEAYGS